MNFDNFSVRLLQQDDLPDYFKLVERNRERLEDFFTGTVSKTKTFEDTRNFVNENLQKISDKTYFPFLVVDNTRNSLAGYLDIKNIDWSIPKAEIGCYIDESYANKGISTKALSLLTSHCFAHYGFKKLFLRTHPQNLSARKVAESCGFEIEGTLRREYRTTAGEVLDMLYYGKLSAT